MSKRLAGCVVVPILILFVLTVAVCVYVRHANYYGALAATKEWARLNEFPATATNFRVETRGNMFTRGFVVQFDAPLADIDTWLNESPGTRKVTPTLQGRVRKYSIEPGGGAQHAELELDETNGHVTINTYWS